MMLQLIIQSIKPTTRVGVSNFKMNIQTETLAMFDNNVNNVLDKMDYNYQEVLEHQHTHPDYII